MISAITRYRKKLLIFNQFLDGFIAAAFDHRLYGEAELFGDKAHNVVFDNTKIKRLVPDFTAAIPFSRGIEEIMEWHDADLSRQIVDEKLELLMDRIIADWKSAF